MNKNVGRAAGVIILAVVAGGIAAWRANGLTIDRNDSLILTGNVDIRQVDLAFKAPGRLERMVFEEGDRVSKGEVVAALETGDFEDELALAGAAVEARRAELTKLQSGARSEELEQAKSAVKSRRAALKIAQATLDRIEALANDDFAPHQRHEEALAARDQAAAALRSAEEGLRIAETGARTEDLQMAQASLAAAEATLNLAERRLEDAKIVAPNDGVILTRVREPGAIVAAGQTVYTLSLSSPMWVRTYVSEPELGRIRAGMRAEIQTDGGRVFIGQVGFISPVAEFTPKTVETRELRTSLVYRVRIIVDEADDALKQGMPVTVSLRTKSEG